jgi:hypothetical protein
MLRYPLGLLLLALCASAEPPKLRLGDDVRPVRYRLDLTLIPEKARNLTFDDAKFIQAGSTVAAKVEAGGKEFAGFALPSSPIWTSASSLGCCLDPYRRRTPGLCPSNL